jgi:hypothetical protein
VPWTRGPDGWPEPDHSVLPAERVAKPLPEPGSISRIDEPHFRRRCQRTWSASSQLLGVIGQLRKYHVQVVPCLAYVDGRVLKSGCLREPHLEVELDRVRDVCLRTLLRLRIHSPSFVGASFEALVDRFPTHLPTGQVASWKQELDRYLESHGPIPIDEAQPNRVREVMPKLPDDSATRLADLADLEDELGTYLETLEQTPDLAFVTGHEPALTPPYVVVVRDEALPAAAGRAQGEDRKDSPRTPDQSMEGRAADDDRWISVTLAAETVGVNPGAISRACDAWCETGGKKGLANHGKRGRERRVDSVALPAWLRERPVCAELTETVEHVERLMRKAEASAKKPGRRV